MAPYQPQSQVLDTYQAVVSAFSEFLTVAVHTILYERDIYPRASFLSARKYNYPVQQNRHPKVCKWIQDAVAAVETELLKGTVSQTSLIIYSPLSTPLERFIFSTENFPIVPAHETLTTFETPPPDNPHATVTDDPLVPTGTTSIPPEPNPRAQLLPKPLTPLIDLHSQFRSFFARLSTLTATLSPLPTDCTFSLAIELRPQPQGVPPLGTGPKEQVWVASEIGLQRALPSDENAAEAMDEGVPRAGEVTGGEASDDKLPPSTYNSDNASTIPNSSSEREAGDGGAGMEKVPYVPQRGRYLGGERTVPVRSVEAGPFVMEVWVEEGIGKEKAVRKAKAMEVELSGESQK